MNQFKQNSEKGSTLVTVTVVMTVIAITLALFLRSQSSTLPSFVKRKDKLQAIANSRSAAIKGLQELLKESEQDTSAINDAPLFEEESSPLWRDSGFGSAKGDPATTPFAQEITAIGEKGNERYTVTAEMRSSFTPSDTVVILCVKSVLAAANLSGTKALFDSDTARNALPANMQGLGLAKSWMEKLFNNDIDFQNPPKTVSTSSEFSTVEDTVHGPLFLASMGSELKINGNSRTVFIDGDLQITGDVTVQDITFLVAGEVRLNDRADLKRCSIFSKKRVFVADESRFSGRIASLKRIEIYGDSKISDRSLIVSFSGKAKEEKKDSTGNSSSEKSSKKTKAGAINIREQAVVDGSCLALGNNGIMTEIDSKTTGILWSRTWIRHTGTHKGVLRALLYKGGDQSQPVPEAPSKSEETPVVVKQPVQQEIIGRVETLFEPIAYPLPWFIGEPSLMKWKEQNQ